MSDRVEELFQAAADLATEERSSYLDQACDGDSELRAEVEDLLANMDVALGRFLERPAVHELELVTPPGTPAELPESVGDFKIVRRIAAGGMGVVYEARQESLDRPVAVKVLLPDVIGEDAGHRFQREASLLARLRHPGIAHIYEAGGARLQFPDGTSVDRPYFAMELIDGAPLNTFAASLPIRERLGLFAAVCDAVQYAHEQGVVHRDLKPGNILVEPEGQPKVLDFGVARVTDADVRAATLQTRTGVMIGTVPYMSPEQVAGDVSGLDERCDIYALGVILYEMLSGRLPLDVAGEPLFVASRVIQEDEPTSLAERVPELRGDVATIVHKALLKEKDRRYSSAGAMAADVRAFLEDRPITARPVSRIYRLTKFARRNKEVVAGVVVAFLALAVGTGVAIAQALRATEKASEAEAAREEAEVAQRDAESAQEEAEVSLTFLVDMLTAVDAEDLGRDVLVADVLERAGQDIETELGDRPAIEGRIRAAIAQAYHSLADDHAALEHGRRALDLFAETHGPTDPRTLAATTELADYHIRLGFGVDAEALLNETLPLQLQTLGPDALQTLNTRASLAEALRLQQRYAESEEELLALIADGEQALGEDQRDVLQYRENLAGLYDAMGRFDKAVDTLSELLAHHMEHLGLEHARTANVMSTLAASLPKVDRDDEARELFQTALALQRRIYGDVHTQTLETLNNMAVFVGRNGPKGQAEGLFREVVTVASDLFGPDDWRTLMSTGNLAGFLIREGRHVEAEPIVLENIAAKRRVLGADHRSVASSLSSLYHCAMAEGEYAAATEFMRESIGILVESAGAGYPGVALYRMRLATAQMEIERHDEAELELVEAVRVLADVYGEDNGRTQEALDMLERAQEAQGKVEEAARTRARIAGTGST